MGHRQHGPLDGLQQRCRRAQKMSIARHAVEIRAKIRDRFHTRSVTMPVSMSLLADLCFKFQAHPEVLATEALVLLLKERVLGDSVGRFLTLQLGMSREIPPGLRFEAQDSTTDGGRPDVVGLTSEGRLCLIIEVKFWAALTEKQPIAYLERLRTTESEPCALVFVAPAIRQEILWSELTRRIAVSGKPITEVRQLADDLQCALVGNTPLVLTSWRTVLSVMSQAAAAAGGLRTSDIHQLSDLTGRMDTDAFLPLRQEELSSQIGQRIYQFNEIVDDVIAALVKEGVFSRTRKSGSLGYYGASVLIRNHWLYFEVSYWHWSQYATTPFWLVYAYTPARSKEWPVLDAAFASLASEVPPRLLKGRHDEAPMMPLHIPTGVERHDVVASLCRKIRDIAQLLPQVTSAAPEPPPPSESLPSRSAEEIKT